MLGNFTNRLWDEILKSLNDKLVQAKLKDSIIVPVIRQLVEEFFPYLVGIGSLFMTIIILLIVVIYNQINVIK